MRWWCMMRLHMNRSSADAVERAEVVEAEVEGAPPPSDVGEGDAVEPVVRTLPAAAAAEVAGSGGRAAGG